MLDEFSERVLDYSNVTLFDYGFLNEVTEFDYTSNGAGVDETVTTFTDTVGGFYEVTRDDVQYSVDRDIDFLSASTVQTDQNGEAVASLFSDFIRVDQGSEEDPNHGDWVIETINQTLQFPEQTEIIAIDLDTLSFGGQWGKAIEVVDYTFGAESFSEPRLATVLFNFLDAYDSRYNSNAQNTYLPVALSASFGEQQVIEGEVSALEYFEFLEVPIFQASANAGQGGVDWGSVYKN